MKYTLEEKLTGKRSKLVGSTCEGYGRELCSCGRGYIEYRRDRNGVKISLHSVYLDSKSFGRIETAPCCEECASEQWESKW